MNYPRVSWRRGLSVGLLVMSLVGAVGLAAQAQERKYKQIDKALVDPRAVKTLRVEVQAILRATNFGPAEQKKLHKISTKLAGLTAKKLNSSKLTMLVNLNRLYLWQIDWMKKTKSRPSLDIFVHLPPCQLQKFMITQVYSS